MPNGQTASQISEEEPGSLLWVQNCPILEGDADNLYM